MASRLRSLLAPALALGWLACGGAGSGPDLRHQAGQMVMVGFRGTSLGTTNPVLSDLRDLGVGGVVLYDRDVPSGTYDRNIASPAQLQALIREVKAAARGPEPLLVAVDQEGGAVARLKERYGFPAPAPSAQSLGTLDDLAVTSMWAGLTGATLREMGFNVDFAPVVDLNVNPDCPVIGRIGRSYGLDATLVVRHAGATVDRLRAQGVLASLKHFPGHGSSTTDSHQGFTDVTRTWTEAELEPFRRLIAAGSCDLVMTAHIFNANLDPVYPATLSRAVLQGILRERLGWDGVVVSDDMMMGAIIDHWDLETALEASVNAGVDLLIFSNNNDRGFDPTIGARAVSGLVRLVEAGRIPRARIDQAHRRILALKARLGR